MRPGCDRPAAARLSYDTISCQVWLDQMPERLGPVQEICQFHAERLTVPRGWTLCDRRVDEPALFEPDARAVRLGPDPLDAEGDDLAAAPSRRPATSGRRRGRHVADPVAEVAPRRTGRRRHPAETARQLFADLDSDLDAELAAMPELDLDTDLDLELDGSSASAAEVAPLPDPEVEVDPEVAAEPAVEAETVAVVEVESVVELAVVEVDLVDEPETPTPAVLRAERPVRARTPRRERTGGLEALVGGVPDDLAHGLPDHAEIMAEIVSVDPDDELPESLRATSPLLARAFRATGPQRSVLSEDLAVPAEHHEDDVAG